MSKKNSLFGPKSENKSRKITKIASQHSYRKSVEVLTSIFGNPALPSFPIQKKATETTTTPTLDGSSFEDDGTKNTKEENKEKLSRAEKKRLWIQNRRKDQAYRLDEQKKDTLRKQLKRKTPEMQELENNTRRQKRTDPRMKEKEKEQKRLKRTEPEVKEKEKEQMRIKRIDPKMKEKEKEYKRLKRIEPGIKEKEKEQKRLKRTEPQMKEKEKEHKQIKRKDPEVKSKEREYERNKRTDPTVRNKERDDKRQKRENLEVREQEKQHKRQKRRNPVVREQEKQHKRQKRRNPVVREEEKQHKRQKRKSPVVREQEKQHKRQKRKNPVVREQEKQHKRQKRKNPLVREQEKQHKRQKRTNPVVRTQEKQQKRELRKSRKPKDFTALIQIFHNKVEEGPVYVCTCCRQLMYRHSVVQTSKATIKTTKTQSLEQLIDSCITETISVDGKEWICRTCFNYLKKSKMPPSAVANKMQFPNQGPLKHLNPLELTLLSPLLPFMKIHQATTGQQYKIRGNMVVVPSDTVNTVQSLPRVSSNTSTIKAKLKRRLRYEHHVYSQNIRPEEIRAAARFLSETGHLYKSLNITYNLDWSDTDIPATSTSTEDTSNQSNDGTTTDDVNVQPTECNNTTPDGKDNHVDSDEEWNEVDTHENNAGTTDTLLTPPDFIESGERDLVYSYAPAENKQPVSIFTEKTAEEQSYPGIFCGQSRVPNESRTVPVTYGEIVKSELRSNDRRCARNVENIFFKTKKLQMKFLIDQTNIAVRKIKTGGQQLTAKDVRKENAQNLIQLDQGYKVLRTLRGSPPYFQAISKDLFAMIRQLGPATFFCTLSAAETQWIHLLRILGKLLDGKDYTNDELENLTWHEKSRLIQSDPVTCTRHFDYSLQSFMNHFILTDLNPIGKVTDWFYRIEFQQRGSPHVHMMLWCTDAPNIDEDSQEDICKYIDKYVTCYLPSEEDELSKLVKLQTHKHSRTCKKKGKKQCRFGFPKPPLKTTQILQPLSPDDEDKDTHQKVWKQIHDALILMQEGEDITFDEFLTRLNLQEDQYINAIRSSISTPTVFLKRSAKEIRVNSYSAVCLQAWRANMDLQFVIDVYACAIYIASYVTKTQRGMSELLRNACKEATVGNKTIKEQVRIIGNKFLNAVEISAQEACYLSLQLPLKRSSRQAIFINTSPPDQRVILLKPQSQLSSMDDNDEEIECKNLLSRYAERPKSMETVNLAEFGSTYEKCRSVVTSRAKSLCKTTRDGLLPDPPQNDDNDDSEGTTTEEDEEYDGPSISKKQETEYRQRKKPKIIRTVHFNVDTDPENYYREQLMLYFPWRDEVTDLIGKCTSYTSRYGQISQQIEEQRQTYEPFRTAVQSAETFIAEQPDLENAWDTVAPNTQHQDQQDRAQNQSRSNDKQPDRYDIGPDLGLPTSVVDDMNSYNELKDHEFRKHMRSLNQQQIQFVYDIIHHIKTNDTPIFRFLSGGAGVGKSFVTKALYQMILKYFNRKAGEDFTTPKVLLMAPTGKAAYHIHGNTIHSTFRIPVNQKLQHKSLDSSSFNTLQNTLGNVKLIFIDEISMVGYKLLNCIHQRLMELKRSRSVFGGVSVIAVGDLFQLKLVMDSYVFQTPKTDYMPLASNLWEENFTMTELDIIMRQRENKHFAELLNRLREGKYTAEDIKLLKTNTIEIDSEDYPYDVPHVFISNEKVNTYNVDVFLRTKSPKVTIKAKDRVLGNYNQEVMNKILESFATKIKDVPQLPTTVQLAEGLAYEITINLDCEDGLINGASCKLMKLKLTDLTHASGILWVKFYDEDTGHHLRRSKKHFYTPDVEMNWTPIEPTSRQYSAGYKGEAQIQRLQFPLRPSAAKTIHRSQGDTVENIVVDLTSNRKIDHIHYVALSRVTSMAGLNIRQLQEDKISINKSVQQEMERLRATDPVPSLKFLYLLPEKFKIVFLNANSLNRHLIDVKMDFSITSADIVAFSETRFIPSDNTSIPNFHCYRQDFPGQRQDQRSPYGLAVYTKEALPSGYPKNINSKTTEMILTEIQNPVQNLQLIFLYKPPKTDVNSLIKHLKTIHQKYLLGKPAIIMGDFNTDFSRGNAAKSKVLGFFQSISYRQLISTPTTDDNTIIDLIFTNLPDEDIQSGTLEVYYSPHKPIWVNNIETFHINNDTGNDNSFQCHMKKLCDDTLILIMSMLPWKQRIAIERVCKRWQILAKNGWHKQESIHFQSVFRRFDGLTDTKLSTILVRCGIYLKKLDISSSPRLLSDMSIDIIAEQCPNVEDVNLSGMAVTDISLRSLGKKCTKIKCICLERCFHVSDRGLQWLFENCQDIESLNIQGNSLISGNCFMKITEKCKTMNLSDCCKLTDKGVMKICRHCPNLQELSISNCQLLSDNSLYSISQNLTGLIKICAGKTFSNVTVNGLTKICKLSQLRCIIMSQNVCVNDEMIETIAISCPFLETIDISGCHRDVTGHGIQSLGFCSSLTSLDISYLYKVDDESIQVLARSGRLRFLTARACSALSDNAFADLACLCPNLELLDVSGCLNISYKTVRYFLETAMDRDKIMTLNIGGTSVDEEELQSNPVIVFCLHDLSQSHLKGDRGIILPEPEPDTDSDDGDENKPTTFSALAAGAEIDDEMDNEWETSEFEYDDLLYCDDPLEMERFELS